MKTHRDPAIIKADISILQTELEQSIAYYSRELLWEDRDDFDKHEMIGFFNITKARTILQALYDGHVLLLSHSAGRKSGYKVWMNPQRNSIFIDSGDELINHENIMSFIVWHAGAWYKVNDIK